MSDVAALVEILVPARAAWSLFRVFSCLQHRQQRIQALYLGAAGRVQPPVQMSTIVALRWAVALARGAAVWSPDLNNVGHFPNLLS